MPVEPTRLLLSQLFIFSFSHLLRGRANRFQISRYLTDELLYFSFKIWTSFRLGWGMLANGGNFVNILIRLQFFALYSCCCWGWHARFHGHFAAVCREPSLLPKSFVGSLRAAFCVSRRLRSATCSETLFTINKIRIKLQNWHNSR